MLLQALAYVIGWIVMMAVWVGMIALIVENVR